MNPNPNTMTALFAENVQNMRGNFFWHNILVKRLAALLYAAEGRPVDSEAIRAAYDCIKQNTGIFSSFRGNLTICLATMLSLAPDMHRQLDNALAVYDMLKARRFWASDYLVMAAYQIAAHKSESEFEATADRMRGFYDGMKAQHFMLTGQDDYIFAAMLGVSGLNVDAGVAQMEQLYRQLKPLGWLGNATQSLTQTLVLGGDVEQAASRVPALRDAFRQQSLRLDREYTMSSLGVLAMLPSDSNTIVEAVSDAYHYLRGQKGFGKWTMTKQELLLLAAGLVALSYANKAQDGVLAANLATNITNIIIAQQTAVAIAAASSAAASASSSSN